ncbi:hypothetical protein ACWIGW_19430 [Nocardia brasiliensis]
MDDDSGEPMKDFLHNRMLEALGRLEADYGDAPIPVDKLEKMESLYRELSEIVYDYDRAHKIYNSITLRSQTLPGALLLGASIWFLLRSNATRFGIVFLIVGITCIVSMEGTRLIYKYMMPPPFLPRPPFAVFWPPLLFGATAIIVGIVGLGWRLHAPLGYIGVGFGSVMLLTTLVSLRSSRQVFEKNSLHVISRELEYAFGWPGSR